MQAIAIADIVVPPNRQRTEIDEPRIVALRDSLRTVGLINPITVRALGEGKYELIAGERRLRARSGMDGELIRCGTIGLGPGMIAANLWDDLDELRRMEVELEENIRRVDLSWQDQCRAVQRLNEMRQAQAAAKGEFYSRKDLAEEAGIKQGPDGGSQPSQRAAQANVMLTIAKHLGDPDVAAAKTVKEAQKVVDKKLRRQMAAGLAKVWEAKAEKEVPHKLIRGDCYEVLATLPDGTFDCILSDPPYGVDADDFGSMASTGHAYEDGEALFQRLVWEFPQHCVRLLKPKGHVYIFCDIRRFDELKDGFSLEGFEVWPWPLIWNKGGRMLPDPKHGPRRAYECILFANKCKREVELVANDVLNIPAVQGPRHGAEKPVGVYRDLLARSTRPGDTVLDPFAGSGTIFPAATLAKCTATGIEISEEYYHLALSRMTEESVRQPSLLEQF